VSGKPRAAELADRIEVFERMETVYPLEDITEDFEPYDVRVLYAEILIGETVYGRTYTMDPKLDEHVYPELLGRMKELAKTELIHNLIDQGLVDA
jgi:hypothetical protein